MLYRGRALEDAACVWMSGDPLVQGEDVPWLVEPS